MKRAVAAFALILLSGCSFSVPKADAVSAGSMELVYAHEFTVEDYGSVSLITIGSDRFAVADRGTEIPDVLSDAVVITRPIENIYNAASSSVDLINALGAEGYMSMTSTKESDWNLPYVRELMKDGKLEYVGKYSSPDYEYILSENCSLAIESTMIYHSPSVKEQLEALGIPVLVERSSYETHPLGRLEWIKLYGVLFGKREEAERYFNEKSQLLESILSEERSEKTAAFFYISSNGSVNIRKPGDYISKMIDLAGGRYVFNSDNLAVDENALSTMNIQMESFYAAAKDADFLIYNSTIEGELTTLGQLTEANPLLLDFRAVKDGNVWCAKKNMFQQTTGAADMISDLHEIFGGTQKQKLTYLHRLG